MKNSVPVRVRLLAYGAEMKQRIFPAFDPLGPHSWNFLYLTLDISITPYRHNFFPTLCLMGLRSPSGHSYSCIGSEPMAQHNFFLTLCLMGFRSPSGHNTTRIGSKPMAQYNFIRANRTSSSHCVSWDYGVPFSTHTLVLGQSQYNFIRANTTSSSHCVS